MRMLNYQHGSLQEHETSALCSVYKSVFYCVTGKLNMEIVDVLVYNDIVLSVCSLGLSNISIYNENAYA